MKSEAQVGAEGSSLLCLRFRSFVSRGSLLSGVLLRYLYVEAFHAHACTMSDDKHNTFTRKECHLHYEYIPGAGTRYARVFECLSFPV